jgi:membrane protein implicated in regulation of membrane protease activity
MRGTIPQWIGAAAIVVIALVLMTRWPEFTPAWVTAVATAVLAFAAIIALAGVFVPLQLERARRRSVHLENIIAIVLEPIRLKLDGGYARVVSRSAFPLECRYPQGLQVTTQPGPFSFDSPPVPLSDSTSEDRSLYDTVYADIKRNHYPQLLADWERFQADYQILIQTALDLAKNLEERLRAGCDLPDLGNDNGGNHGCFYASLALYAFNRVWHDNYPYPLSEQSEIQKGTGQWKLWCLNISTEYARGSQDEMIKLKTLVESAIKSQDVDGLKNNGQALLTRLKALQAVIADIRANGRLRGDCIATK